MRACAKKILFWTSLDGALLAALHRIHWVTGKILVNVIKLVTDNKSLKEAGFGFGSDSMGVDLPGRNFAKTIAKDSWQN